MTPNEPQEPVVLRVWPATLTMQQLQAYTNWPKTKIETMTKRGTLICRRSGRAGSRLWLRQAVKEVLHDEFQGTEGGLF